MIELVYVYKVMRVVAVILAIISVEGIFVAGWLQEIRRETERASLRSLSDSLSARLKTPVYLKDKREKLDGNYFKFTYADQSFRVKVTNANRVALQQAMERELGITFEE